MMYKLLSRFGFIVSTLALVFLISIPLQSAVADNTYNFGINGSSDKTSGSYSAYGDAGFDFGAPAGFEGWDEPKVITQPYIDVTNPEVGVNFLGCHGIDMYGFADLAYGGTDMLKQGLIAMATKIAIMQIVYGFSKIFVSINLPGIISQVEAVRDELKKHVSQGCDLGKITETALANARKVCGEDGENCNNPYKPLDIIPYVNKVNAIGAAMMDPLGVLSTSESFCDRFDAEDKDLGSGKNIDKTCASTAFMGALDKDGKKQKPPVSMARSHQAAARGGSVILQGYQGAIQSVFDGDISMSQALITLGNGSTDFNGPADLIMLNDVEDSTITIALNELHPIYFGAAEKSKFNKTEFKQFIHCAETSGGNKITPFTHLEEFLEGLKRDWGFKDAKITEIQEKNKEYLKEITELAGKGITTENKVLAADIEGASAMVGTAVECVYTYNMHIGIKTLLTLQVLPKATREAYYGAAKSRGAFLATELVLRYLKHKILEGLIEVANKADKMPVFVANGGGCKKGPFLTPAKVRKLGGEDSSQVNRCPNTAELPPSVLVGIQGIADQIENQIKALNAIKKEQDAFAIMSAKIAEKRDELLGNGIKR